jgi:hypothetical protein
VAASSGITPVALHAYIGHASYRTTERYLDHAPTVEDAAKLTAAFGLEALSANAYQQKDHHNPDDNHGVHDLRGSLSPG